jgi:hypothetical protein
VKPASGILTWFCDGKCKTDLRYGFYLIKVIIDHDWLHIRSASERYCAIMEAVNDARIIRHRIGGNDDTIHNYIRMTLEVGLLLWRALAPDGLRQAVNA